MYVVKQRGEPRKVVAMPVLQYQRSIVEHEAVGNIVYQGFHQTRDVTRLQNGI
jgi:hypothetical protein